MSASSDVDLRSLRRFRPSRREPPDFDSYWRETLRVSREQGGRVQAVPTESGLTQVRTYDVAFPGWDGQLVKAWLHLPAQTESPAACVVEFSDYGHGRGLPHERVHYAVAGHGHLIVDARGQSGGDRRCDTPDRGDFSVDTASVMTRGIDSAADCYLRRLITDSVRAVDAVSDLPGLRASRVVVAGVGQGGGLGLAVSALAPVAGLLCDLPLLAGCWKGVSLATAGPYTELKAYLAQYPEREQAMWRTLGYMDAMNFAPRSTAPALFSVGLEDAVSPPAAVFSALNHYAGPKRIDVWPYNGHEGGRGHQERRSLDFLRLLLAGGPPEVVLSLASHPGGAEDERVDAGD